jgi:hypothetical protein
MLVKPAFKPGIMKTDTGLDSEGGFADGNLVRFWQGKAEPVGGWALHTVQTFDGIARGAKAWTTLTGRSVFAFGSSAGLYAVIGGSVRNITPNLLQAVRNNIFSTVNGSPVVTVNIPFHRLVEGDALTFSNHQSTVGGLTIEGAYTVTEVLTRDTFTITHGSNASSTVTAGGGFVDIVIPLPVGIASTPFTGYGSGEYGDGPYGESAVVEVLRVWSVDNWGENGLFNPSGYGLFEWQPAQAYLDLAFNGDFATSGGWGLGTGWAIGSGVATKTAGTASNLSQDVEGVFEGGRTYLVTFDVTRTAGSLKLRMNAGTIPAVIDVGEASSAITKTGSYTRIVRAPADPLDIVFEADASFAGTVDNVVYRLFDKAYRISTAPPRIDAMFVDPKGLVVTLGTTQVDGIYNPTCLRTSDIGNNRSYIPDTNSIASEYVLRGGGGRLMAGLPTRQQNIAWGDDGVFSLQYRGEPGDAFNIQLLGTGCGLISRHAMAEGSGFVFWMSNAKQFYIFRGVGATNLGVPEIVPCTVREDLFDNLDQQQLLKIHAGVNPKFSEVWWWYPDTRDGNECSRAVAFSWTDGPWSIHQLPRTAWIAAGPVPNPLGFAPEGLIYDHEVGTTANGAPMNAFIETSDFDVQDGDNFIGLLGIWPDFARQVGNVRITIKSKRYPNEPSFKVTATVPELCTPTTQKLDFRVKARQTRMRIESASTECFWRMGAVRLDAVTTTARR